MLTMLSEENKIKMPQPNWRQNNHQLSSYSRQLQSHWMYQKAIKFHPSSKWSCITRPEPKTINIIDGGWRHRLWLWTSAVPSKVTSNWHVSSTNVPKAVPSNIKMSSNWKLSSNTCHSNHQICPPHFICHSKEIVLRTLNLKQSTSSSLMLMEKEMEIEKDKQCAEDVI